MGVGTMGIDRLLPGLWARRARGLCRGGGRFGRRLCSRLGGVAG